MRKRMKRVAAALLAGTMMMAMVVPAYAFTPSIKINMPKIPTIHVELSDETKEAVSKAAQESIKKTVLDKPVITGATYHHKGTYYGETSYLKVEWDAVENATSYEVEVTKSDGTSKKYTVTDTDLFVKEKSDEFITGCPKQKINGTVVDATVTVRAHGADDTRSLWSDTKSISCNRLFH